MTISGVKSLTDGSSLCTRSRQAANDRKRAIVSANEPVIRNKFFFASVAWWIPKEVSILKTPDFAAQPPCFDVPVFPDTAATGETFAACFAGEWAAINTVTIPTTAPQRIPVTLTEKSGISAHSPFTRNLNIAHNIQQVIVPSIQPIGIAVLHQFNASSLTKCMICFLLAPIHLIIPKNFVRCATVLFMQLEIINTPEISIMTKQIAANGYSWFILSLLLAPNILKTAIFSFTFSSVKLYFSLKSAIVFFNLFSFWKRM